MNNDERLQQLLQECLALHERGLSPEECLRIYPGQRADLEPLLRQALSLRVAFAATPDAEFRAALNQKLMFVAGREAKQAFARRPDPEFVGHGRERLLFAAGREATAAFSAEPKPEFVDQTRRAVLRSAGAAAQEALRDVPPPRLPFWVNARRRLLEAASRPRPVHQPMPNYMRRGLSFAVIALAMVVAGLAFLTTSQPTTPSVNAQLQELEQQLLAVEQQQAAGQIIPPGVLSDLSRKTNEIAGKLNEQPTSTAPLSEKLPSIIDRQKEVIQQAAVDSVASQPVLRQIEQDLQQAEEKVRVLAARSDQPTVKAPQIQPSIEPTATPTDVPATPTATPKPGTVTPAPTVEPGQVRIGLVASDNTYGLRWKQIETADMSFLVPADWKVIGVTTSNGTAVLESAALRFDGDGTIVLTNTATGEIQAIVGGKVLVLRTEGSDGETIDIDDLITKTGDAAPALHHLLESVSYSGLVTKATPTPTATPSR